ncbi:MAG: serine hydrolase [Thermacetogeniaceae bacterium]
MAELRSDGQQDAGVALKPYKNAPRDRLDEEILSRMWESRIVGLSFAFVRGGEVIRAGGYGWADLEKEKPAGPDTIYRIASVSKTITATALMQLWERGLFDLDDDIGSYLGYPVRNPKYPDDKITFRMLLTHTSSILDSGGYEQALRSPQPPLLRDLLVPGGRAYTPATWGDYRPGTRFNYSNFGAGIVGALVEVLSGERFNIYAKNHIFAPLGMDAGYELGDIERLEKVAVLYRPAGDDRFVPSADLIREGEIPQRRPLLPLGNYYIGPAGSVRSSVLDLAKFMIAHMSGGAYRGVRILGKKAVDLMHQLHWFGFGLGGMFRKMGLFFHITDAFAGRLLRGHPGEAYGLVGDMYFDRNEGTGVILMVNGGYYTTLVSGFTDIEEDVLNKVYIELAGKAVRRTKVAILRLGSSEALADGRSLFSPVPPEEKPGDVYIPAGVLADLMDAYIESKEDGASVFLLRRGISVSAEIGRCWLDADGQRISLSTPAYLKGGHVMLPFVTVARAFGGEVDYRDGEITAVLQA